MIIEGPTCLQGRTFLLAEKLAFIVHLTVMP